MPSGERMNMFKKNSKWFVLFKYLIGKGSNFNADNLFAIKEVVKNGSGGIWASCYNKVMHDFNCWIGEHSYFENIPTFPHKFYGIFISNGAKIGKNCVIFHQVTIGSNNLTDSKNKGCPIIGDNVFIGAGAKIIGNVEVGNNCRIGANAVVVKDVPDNSIVVSQPSRIIYKENMDNTFYALDISKIGKANNETKKNI